MKNIKRVTVGAALLLTMLASVISASAETVKTYAPPADRAVVVGGVVPAVAVTHGVTGTVTQVADRDDYRY
ncbi:MAG TPA: hypothetical protein VEZ90_15305, partial [Blastocatellia bacterium]|nr:hypothetical protein [Blastocatellia bacterium]